MAARPTNNRPRHTFPTMFDPFDVFGDSDDDDEQDEGNISSSSSGGGQGIYSESCGAADAARLLVQQANERMRASALSEAAESAAETNAKSHADDDEDKDEAEPLQQQSLPSQWPDRPPLYIGPMVVTSDNGTGGGRGYVASRNIGPGTLLLVEEPVFTWPREQVGRELGLVSMMDIVRRDGAERIVRDMELLHPTMDAVDDFLNGKNSSSNGNTGTPDQDLQQVDKMMELMERKHANDATLHQILDISSQKGITRSDGKAIQKDDVFRMLLTLRYNGFGTGLYLHFAMLNHDEDPNCIKFAPEAEADSLDASSPSSSFSEIRTTRFVKRGEALTIFYLDPREVSHATRRHHLWDQHRFDIGDDVVNRKLRQFDHVDGKIPKSLRDRREEDTAYRIEKVISELEEQMDEIKDYFSTGNFISDEVERAKAIEVASLEFITVATQQLNNPRHLLVVRCYKLHLDASEALLKADSAAGLSSAQRNGIMCRFVKTARKLLALQILFLGDHHVDVGRTYHDLYTGLNTLLSHVPKQLFALKLEGMKNFAQCSKEEDRYRREYERINTMYPRNTMELVNKNVK